MERDQIVAMMTSLTDLSKKSHTKEDLPQSEKLFFSIFYDFRDLRKIEIEKRKLRILEAGDFD